MNQVVKKGIEFQMYMKQKKARYLIISVLIVLYSISNLGPHIKIQEPKEHHLVHK